MVDITIMPEETTIGANTFGCLFGGWLYVGGRYSNFFDKSILFTYSPIEEKVFAFSKVKPDVAISFTIDNPVEGARCKFTDLQWGALLYEGEYGVVDITRFDKITHIISGRFSGGHIEHGRFDVKYTETPEPIY
jgi:hypothetical protein